MTTNKGQFIRQFPGIALSTATMGDQICDHSFSPNPGLQWRMAEHHDGQYILV